MKYGCVGLVLLIAVTAWGQDADKDAKALEGKWTPASAELAGAKLSDAQLKAISLTVAAGKYTVQAGKSTDRGTLKLDPTAKPKSMDIVGTDGPNKGKTLLAIYEVQQDTLRICYDLEGKKRPTDFTTSKEKPFFLVVYQRAKP
jgi:uncharacterized protein (TIGR03067 family)